VIIAVTGGTGFLGTAILRAGVAAGHQVRALTRKPQLPGPQVQWIEGTLERPESLARLVRGADAVIHAAGVINARTRAAFDAGNAAGTANMLAAAGTRRFVHVSSLAARESGLSMYGDSKAAAERLVEQSQAAWDMVRPPAIYGPGDRETLMLFKMAKLGLILVPGQGRASFIHVDDLAACLVGFAGQPATRAVHEVDDGVPGGWDHRELGHLIGAAVGKRPAVIPAPGWAMLAAAWADTAFAGFSGALPKMSVDRARYFNHPDWVSRTAPLPFWQPTTPTPQGLAATARWYRDAGWL
jgi:uncharacterized protein YbjT (DUF2867 family)